MKQTKRILSFLMAVLLTVCATSISVIADSADVAAATQLIEALPALDTITDPDSQAYTDATDAAYQAIYALAECSEEEMMEIPDFNKPFDLVFQLWVLPADLANAPTTIPASHQEVFDQLEWELAAADTINHLPDHYSLFDAYTTTNDQGNTMGMGLLEQLVDAYYDVAVRVEAYISTLPTEEQDAINQQIEERFETMNPTLTDAELFAKELAAFPDEFTVDNILDYAADFNSFYYDVEAGWYDTSDALPTDLEKYERLSEEFQLIIGIYRDDVLNRLEQRIEEVCDIDSVKTYSPLKMKLFVEEECMALERTIYTIEDTLGSYAERHVENLDLFNEYYNAVFYSPYLPPYTVGDVDDDGDITASDALEILKAVVERIYLTPAQELAADLDGDGTFSSSDALEVLKYVVGKSDLPVPYSYAIRSTDYTEGAF